MKLVSSLLVLFLILLPLHALATARVGGWRPIRDVKNPHVVAIGKFAVSEYDRRSKAHLRFASVVSGETQVVSGTKYRLLVVVKDGGDGGRRKKYEAVVLEKPWLKSRNLTSFKPAHGRIY